MSAPHRSTTPRCPGASTAIPRSRPLGPSERTHAPAGLDVVVKKNVYAHNGRALIVGEPDGMVKASPKGRRGGPILGFHMVGPWASELMHEGYLAVNWEATPDEAGHFIQPHPTLSEAFGEAVLALTGRGLHL